MQAMGAPQLQAELGARNVAQAESEKLQAQYDVRKKLIEDYKKENPNATNRDAMMYLATVEGRAMPYQLMRGQKVTVAGPDGRPQLGSYDPYTHEYLDQNDQVIPGARPYLKPRVGYGKDAQGFYSFDVDPATNAMVPGTENRNALPPSGYLSKIKSGHHYYTDENGDIHDMPETTVTGPAIPAPPSGAGSVPTRRTGAKSKSVSPAGAPAASGNQGRVIGHTLTAPEKTDYNQAIRIVNDARKDYDAAIDRMKTMDQNLIDGLKGNQQAMLSLVANHIGMTLGAQKGARITRAVWDEATESAPWLKRVQAHFDSRGYLSGVTLTPEQMHQMVDLGHQRADILKEHVDRVADEYQDVLARGHGGKPTVPPPPSATISADDEIMNLVKKAKGAKK